MTIDMTKIYKYFNSILPNCKIQDIRNDSTSCVVVGTRGTIKFTITLSIICIDVREDKSIQEDLQVSIATELENRSNFYITHITVKDSNIDEFDIVCKVSDSLTNCVNFTVKQWKRGI